MNSKRKGAGGEREFASYLSKTLNISARRSQQYCGHAGDADIHCDLPIHWEVKRVERLQIDAAMKQAMTDCKDDSCPVVAHRKNRGEWLITLRADDMLRFAKILADHIQ